jgi:hypothetical protein
MTRPIDDLFGELSRPLGPTDWPEPAQLRRKAEHKRTVRRASIASSLAVVAAFAFAVPATLAHRHSVASGPAATVSLGTIPVTPAPRVTTAPTATATPVISADPSPLAAGLTVMPQGPQQHFGTFSLAVPQGWQVDRTAGVDPFAARIGPYQSACIHKDGTSGTRADNACPGLEIWYGGALPGAGLGTYNTNREHSAAWHHGSAPAVCPNGAAAVEPLTSYAHWLFPEINGRKYAYQDWDVACADGTTFHPQAWYLPDNKVVIFSYDGGPQAQALLATATITGG